MSSTSNTTKYFERSADDVSLKVLALAQIYLPERPREFHGRVLDLVRGAEETAFQNGCEYTKINERLNREAIERERVRTTVK